MPKNSAPSVNSSLIEKKKITESEKKEIIAMINKGDTDQSIIDDFLTKNYDFSNEKLNAIKSEIEKSKIPLTNTASTINKIPSKEDNRILTAVIEAKYDKDGLKTGLIGGNLTVDSSSKNIDISTCFAVGSVTKMFTSATMLKLCDNELTLIRNGKIAKDQANFPEGIDTKLSHFMEGLKEKNPDCKYLEEIEKSPHYDKITLRDLLNHTHGLGSRDEEKMAIAQLQNPHKQFSCAEIVDFSKPDPDSQYGKFKYGNLGTEISGMIIELVTNKSFDKAIKETILEPLELSKTEMKSFNPPDNYANGYCFITPFEKDGNLYGNQEINYNNSGNSVGAGGIITNAQDGAKFMHAFLTEKVENGSLFKNQETINSLYRDKDLDQPHAMCGVNKLRDGTFGHNGDNGNSEASFSFDPKTKEVKIYMATSENLTSIIATEQLIKEGNKEPTKEEKHDRVIDLIESGYDFKKIRKEIDFGKSIEEIASESKVKIDQMKKGSHDSPRSSTSVTSAKTGSKEPSKALA